MIRRLCWGLLVAGSLLCAVESDAARKDFHLNPSVEHDIGYSQAVRIGDTLYISGSVGAGDMPAAIHQAYDELKATLKAHGLDFGAVVKENIYTTDIDAFIKHMEIRKHYYGTTMPAATWVQVQRLYLPDHVVEVELVAVFPADRPASRHRANH
jgi:2-iminobutanoate/2-iminopropanoate deaminase